MRRPTTLRRAGSFVLATVLLVACGDPDTDIVKAGLLRIEDLPPGFRSLPEDDVPAGAAKGEQPSECQAIEEVAATAVVVEESSPAFASADAVVANDVVAYGSDFVATEVLRVWSETENAAPCMELLLSAFVGMASINPFFASAFGAYEVSAQPLEVPALGDERVGWRGNLSLEGAEGSESISVDVIPVRVGRAVVTFVFFGLGSPVEDLRDPLLRTVVDRVVEEAG